MSFAERDSRTKKLTGRWAVDFWYKAKGEPDRRMRRAFATKLAADTNEAYARARGCWADPEADEALGPTFKAAVADMRAKHDVWQKGRDPSGQRRLDWITDRIGHRPINQVSTGDLDDLVLDLLRRPVKSKRNTTGRMKGRTVNGYLTMASAVLTWAAARPKQFGDFKTPEIPWQAVEETRIHFMTEAQGELLNTHLMRKGLLDSALILRVLRASGMRWGELAGLEPHMVQVAKLATGQSIGWIKLDKSKTDAPRDIPVPVEMAKSLKALIVNGPSPNYSRLRMQFDAAKEVLGLPPALTMYGARHGAATYLTKRGLAPAKIQQFMGHKSYKTTEKYVHVENEDLAAAAEILNPTLGGEDEIQPEADIVDFKKAN
jgi:integrase